MLQEAVRPDVVERLASACGMAQWGAVRGHSLAFMSRIDVERHTWHRVPLAKRRYLELVLREPGPRVFGVHLAAVHSNLTERRRVWELQSLLRGIRQQEDGFNLVLGDFNTLAPGEALDVRRLPARLQAIVWLTGRNIRWRAIRLMLAAGYADCYRIFHKDDEGFTFPVWDPHVRLDYAFVPVISAVRITRCEIVRTAPSVREASDHFPLLSEIADA